MRPLAQRTFDDFFFKKKPALRAYSGQTLTLAMPIYETANRRPARLVRMDRLRLTVKADGSLDRDEYRRLVKDAFTALFPAADAAHLAQSRLADAGMLSADKLLRSRWSPKISEEAYKRILAHLGIR
ncbi:MAG TPA: hypothetical protein VH934_18670 [Xanthobacteraceae bacterium]